MASRLGSLPSQLGSPPLHHRHQPRCCQFPSVSWCRTSTPSELSLLSASPSPVNDLDTNLCFSSKIEDRSSTRKQRQW
ncbi:unnamed protein product, partial [Musa banksii]